MRIIYLDILEISFLLLNKFKQRKITAKTIYDCLKYRNPSFYNNLTIFETKESMKFLFPIHKNVRRNCKFFKLSNHNVEYYYKRIHIRPKSDIKVEHFNLTKFLQNV